MGEFSVILLGYSFPQLIHGRLFSNGAVTDYGCEARKLSGL